MSDMQRVSDHLRRLGYEIEVEDHFTRAAHDNNPVILVRGFEGGVMLVTAFKVDETNDETKVLYFVNDLNLQAISARFVVYGQGDFTMEVWLPSPYDPEGFTNLFARWQRDLAMVIQHKDARAILAS